MTDAHLLNRGSPIAFYHSRTYAEIAKSRLQQARIPATLAPNETEALRPELVNDPETKVVVPSVKREKAREVLKEAGFSVLGDQNELEYARRRPPLLRNVCVGIFVVGLALTWMAVAAGLEGLAGAGGGVAIMAVGGFFWLQATRRG